MATPTTNISFNSYAGATTLSKTEEIVFTRDPANELDNPNAIDFTDVVDVVTGATSTSSTNTETITGLGTTINLRFEFASNMAASESVDIVVNGTVAATISAGSSQGTVSIANNDTVRLDMTFVNDRSETVTVRNVTRSEVEDTFALTIGVNTDFVPDALNWADITDVTTAGSSTASNAAQSFTGVETMVDMRISLSSNLPAGASLDVYIDGTVAATINAGSSQVDFRAASGSSIYFSVTTTADITSYTATVINLDDSNTTLDTFSINVDVAVDDVPDALAWSDVSIITESASASASTNTETVAGIETAISLKAAISSNLNGVGSLDVVVNGTVLTTISGTETEETFTVASGDTVRFDLNATADVSSRTVTVTNESEGSAVLDTFTVAANVSLDVTPNAVNWADLSIVTTAASGSAVGASQTINGIETAITLRAAISSAFSGAGSLDILVDGTVVDTLDGAETSIDFSVASGSTVAFTLNGTSDFTSRTITVSNQSATGTPTLDTFTVIADVAVDDVPDALAWSDVSILTAAASGSGSTNTDTVTGIETAITLKAALSANLNGIGSLDIVVNGTVIATIENTETEESFTVASGDTVRFDLNATADISSRTVTVTNESEGSATLDTFTIDANVLFDIVPDAVNWADISVVTTAASGSASNSSQTINGVDTAITIRVATPAFGASSTLDVVINGTVAGSIGPSASSDFVVTNADTVAFTFNAGQDTASRTVTVTNQSDSGTNLDTFTVTGDVAVDDVPDALNWNDVNEVTTAASGTFSTNTETIAGLETAITLKATAQTGSPWAGSAMSGFTVDVVVNGTVVETLGSGGGANWSKSFTVAATDTVRFDVNATADVTGWRVLVENASEGDADLDSFLVDVNVNADEVPDAINWSDQAGTTGVAGPASVQTSTKTLQGIDTGVSITLRLDAGEVLTSGQTLEVIQNGTVTATISSGSQTVDFTAADNDTLAFKLTGSEAETLACTLTNQSDGGTSLDTFSLSINPAVQIDILGDDGFLFSQSSASTYTSASDFTIPTGTASLVLFIWHNGAATSGLSAVKANGSGGSAFTRQGSVLDDTTYEGVFEIWTLENFTDTGTMTLYFDAGASTFNDIAGGLVYLDTSTFTVNSTANSIVDTSSTNDVAISQSLSGCGDGLTMSAFWRNRPYWSGATTGGSTNPEPSIQSADTGWTILADYRNEAVLDDTSTNTEEMRYNQYTGGGTATRTGGIIWAHTTGTAVSPGLTTEWAGGSSKTSIMSAINIS